MSSFPADNRKKLEVRNYVNVREQAAKLGQTIPNGVVLLPSSFESAKSANDLIYADTIDTVRKLLVQAGVPAAKMEKDGEQYPRTVQHALEWIGPVILISAAAYSQNPEKIVQEMEIAVGDVLDWETTMQVGRKVVRVKKLE